jgi:pyruvate,water dikinase
MSQREDFRSEPMRVFLRLRKNLIDLAEERDVLEQDVWLLDADEVRRLDEDWMPEPSLFERRRRDLADARRRPMPDLISRFGSHADDEGKPDGVGLVAGVVHGRAWVLTEPSTRPPTDFGDEPLVLVAPSVDAGWLPTFSMVDAVAVEMGGDLSHGSIILREVGLPAVTNLAGLRSRLHTGDHVRVDGDTGTVDVIDS